MQEYPNVPPQLPSGVVPPRGDGLATAKPRTARAAKAVLKSIANVVCVVRSEGRYQQTSVI